MGCHGSSESRPARADKEIGQARVAIESRSRTISPQYAGGAAVRPVKPRPLGCQATAVAGRPPARGQVGPRAGDWHAASDGPWPPGLKATSKEVRQRYQAWHGRFAANDSHWEANSDRRDGPRGKLHCNALVSLVWPCRLVSPLRSLSLTAATGRAAGPDPV